MNKKTVKDVSLKGKKVLIRVDFNVPLNDDLVITDDIRIQSAVPTLQYVLEQQPEKVILMSHMGRPKGQVVDKLRLNPVADRLSELLGMPVLKLDDCIGDDVSQSISQSKETVVLLENLRFYKEETANDAGFAKQLASLADVYVNDAFGTAHRAHASTEGVTHHLMAAAGFLLEKELKFLGQAVSNPERPYAVILGGAKVSDKIMLIENLLDKADTIIIGGGMAYTFLKAQGLPIGNSICEDDRLDTAKELLQKAKDKNVRFEVTSDFLIVDEFNNTSSKKIVDEIPDGWESLDIGPKTIARYKEALADAKTIVWNGPMGVFEIDAYADGTKEIAEFLGSLESATTIVGGGDSAAAVKKYGLEAHFTHISTGGGASLELLEGKELPGIKALTDRDAVSA